MADCRETGSLRHHMTSAHMNSQILAVRIRPAQVQSRWVPGTDGGCRHGLPSLIQKLPATDTCRQMKNLFSPYYLSYHCILLITAQGRFPLQEQMANTKYQWCFPKLFRSFCFVWTFFYLIVLLLIYFDFSFWCFCVDFWGGKWFLLSYFSFFLEKEIKRT